MVFSKVGPNQSIEWGQIRVSKSCVLAHVDASGIRVDYLQCYLLGLDLSRQLAPFFSA